MFLRQAELRATAAEARASRAEAREKSAVAEAEARWREEKTRGADLDQRAEERLRTAQNDAREHLIARIEVTRTLGSLSERAMNKSVVDSQLLELRETLKKQRDMEGTPSLHHHYTITAPPLTWKLSCMRS